jgi:hypothetical protein
MKGDAVDLLDRYLQAVKKHLPWKRQDDILAELRANLEAQLEDKESELGRPLTQGEAEDWLRQLGAPMQVAMRYQPQQYLIGPAIFPTYWFVLRLVFLWATIIYVIVSAVQIFAARAFSDSFVLEAVLRVPAVLMTAAAWVTLIFAALEFCFTHYPAKFREIAGKASGGNEALGLFSGFSGDWSPAALPAVEEEQNRGKKPRSYAQAVAEVIFGFLFLVWLLLVPKYPFLLLGPGVLYLKASPFQLAPVWIQFFWWVVALNVIQLAWQSLDLGRGAWQGPRVAQQMVVKTFGLIPLVLLLTIPDQACVVLKHPAVDQAQYGAALVGINHSIHWGLQVALAIIALHLGWEIAQMCLRVYRKRVAAVR